MKPHISLPSILVDSREQTPLVFPAMVQVQRRTLKTGDYSIAGYEDLFTVERKSLPDLVNTVIHDRARFERELERMTKYPFRRLLIVAPWERVLKGQYRFSAANGKAVMASVSAFEVRYGIPAVFVSNPAEAAKRLTWWAWYYVRERLKTPKGEGA
jgi:ERCC4-type nuclease